MKIKLTYGFLFWLLVIQVPAFATSDSDPKQQIDSLIKASTNRVYEKPNESINLGVSTFENTSYSTTTRTRALMLVSLAYTSKRDYQKALKYIIKADAFSSDLNDKKLQIEILFMTGILYQQLKIFDKSIELMENVEKMSLTYPVRDSIAMTLANSYIVKGFIYKDNLNCDIAIEYFDKGINEYDKLDSTNFQANLSIVYYNKGNCYTMLSEYENAKRSFNKAISFAKRENANSLISFAKKGLAEVYTIEGNYLHSISLLQTALQQSKNVGDLVLNLGIYKGLFENYLALNQWEKYQKYYNLYLKTQLEIKISERNSISDSIIENTKNQNEKSDRIQKEFRTKITWISLIIILIVISVLLIESKNKKIIKTLQNKVEFIQNTKPLP
ncbi:MAG: tetratricopeptide repeat protein [Flavobacteriaceae bacterium]